MSKRRERSATSLPAARTASRTPSGPLDLGVLRSIASRITPAAESYLQDHPLLAALAERNAVILRDLKAEGAPVGGIAVDVDVDPEIRGRTSIVFEVDADADWSEVRPWDEELRRRRLAFEQELSTKGRDANLLNIIILLMPASVREFQSQMQLNPADFLDLATELAGRAAPREAESRTAISRAYYAAFLAARAHAVRRGIFSISGAADDHGRLVRAMRAEPDPPLQRVAEHLQGLRSLRNRSDYDVSWTPSVTVARLAVAQARSILAGLPR